MERSNSLIRLPPLVAMRRRPVWLPMVLLALCFLPLFANAARAPTGNDERPEPTKKLVEALNRAILAPAQARALVHASVENPVARTEMATPPMFGSMMEMAKKPLFLGPTGDRERALDCLALAAWYEAGNDAESERSVIQVVLNRVAHPSFPKSVCGVVFQGSQRSAGCQFTFTCDGSMLRRHPPTAAFARARALASFALQGEVFRPVMYATHYHADYVVPWWSSQLVMRGKVGRHIFYSWPGKRGILSGRPSSMGEADFAKSSEASAIPGTGGPGPGVQARGEAALDGAQLAIASAAVATPLPLGPAPKPGNSILLTIDSAQPSGRWAVMALGSCAGKAGCRVLGYETQDQVARNSSVAVNEREKPAFLFVRDAASGIELALWDCEKVRRPAPNQCLPTSARELARMLRDSPG